MHCGKRWASLDALGGQVPFAHVADRDVELHILAHHLADVSDLELTAAGQDHERDRVPFHHAFGDLFLAVGIGNRAGQLLAIHLEIEVDLQHVSVLGFHVPFPLAVQVGGVGRGQACQHYDCAEGDRESSHFRQTHARTERRYARLPLESAVEDLNRVLRGWGNYFRYGNSADKFNHIDAYVNERLAILASAKHGLQGRNWRDRFNYEWSTQLGIYRLGGTVKPTLAYASRWTMSESRVRENRT